VNRCSKHPEYTGQNLLIHRCEQCELLGDMYDILFSSAVAVAFEKDVWVTESKARDMVIRTMERVVVEGEG